MGVVASLGQVGLRLSIWPLPLPQNLTDAIARAAADTLQGPMQAAYREAFQSVVLPAFEKSCQAMFQQINDSFRLGTQECEWVCMTQRRRDCLLLPSLLWSPWLPLRLAAAREPHEEPEGTGTGGQRACACPASGPGEHTTECH